MRAHRIVHEVQDQFALRFAVADFIETLQRANAGIEGPFAPLLVDIFLGIAGQRTNQLDLVLFEKLGKIILARLKNNREITRSITRRSRRRAAATK